MIKILKTSIEKIRDLLYNSKINFHIFTRIDNVEFEIFVVDNDIFKNKLSDKILQFKSITSTFNSGLVCKSDNKIIIICTDENKIENLAKILYEHNKISENQYNKLIYDVYKYLSTSFNDINEIKTKYSNTIITKNGILIYYPITPSKFLYKNKLFDIPKKDQSKINSMEFITNDENKIVSVKIDGGHPNADKSKEFCLGNLKFLELKLKSVDAIINTIAVYNINNSYYIPNSIKSIINSIDIK